MNKDKITKLLKYIADIQSKLDAAPTPKHSHRPNEYKSFLTKELALSKSKLVRLQS
jgi:hypothetical protein